MCPEACSRRGCYLLACSHLACCHQRAHPWQASAGQTIRLLAAVVVVAVVSSRTDPSPAPALKCCRQTARLTVQPQSTRRALPSYPSQAQLCSRTTRPLLQARLSWSQRGHLKAPWCLSDWCSCFRTGRLPSLSSCQRARPQWCLGQRSWTQRGRRTVQIGCWSWCWGSRRGSHPCLCRWCCQRGHRLSFRCWCWGCRRDLRMCQQRADSCSCYQRDLLLLYLTIRISGRRDGRGTRLKEKRDVTRRSTMNTMSIVLARSDRQLY